MEYRQAEWYDAVALEYWRDIEPELRTVLKPWAGTRGLALDLGAGTGLTTAALADVCAGEVLACEPESAMRVGIMSRIVGVEDHRRRVTVLPWGADELCCELDEPVEVLTAISMLDHLAPTTRTRLLQWAAQHLSDSGALILGPFAPTEAADTTSAEAGDAAHAVSADPAAADPAEPPAAGADSPEGPLAPAAEAPPAPAPRDPELGEQFTSVEVGRLRYTGWARWDNSTGQERWHMTWQMHRGEALLDERRAVFYVHPAAPAQLSAEAASAGLTARSVGRFLVLQRTSERR